jgi:hypothetical protein
MIEIEKNVPIPGKRGLKYPFLSLAVGDSFFVPGGTQKDVTGYMTWAQKKSKFRFTARTIEGGIRVWRIK